MKFRIFSVLLLLGQWVNGQQLIDFEEFNLGLDSAILKGEDQLNGKSGFITGDVFLPNVYDEQFNFFTEWAITSGTDTFTAGPSNSTSAFAGGGHESSTYAVASAFTPVNITLLEDAKGSVVNGLQVTNNTYAALSMEEGDAFAKRFGGETGDDPDFFKLTIKNWFEGVLSQDSVDFYLADYRFEDNAQDYIIKDWTFVDLSSLGPTDSLQFMLTSTDNGIFGMNTPAFFCIDDLSLETVSSISSQKERNPKLLIYPNPTSRFLLLPTKERYDWVRIFDLTGRLLLFESSPLDKIDVHTFDSGVYIIEIRNDLRVYRRKFIKK